MALIRDSLLRKSLLAGFALTSALAAAQVDPQLGAAIAKIQAIDDHSHVVAPDAAHDHGYDALRCELLPLGTALAPANTRWGPDAVAAWKTLYGETPASGEAAAERLPVVQEMAKRTHGAGYFDWALAQAGVDTVMANRVTMAAVLKPPHFRWVPYDDPLLFPLDNSALKQANPDRKALFEMDEALRAQYWKDASVGTAPASLDEYVDRIVKPTLARQKAAGALAIKFEAAYLRHLDFAFAAHDAATAAYARFAAGGVPDSVAYKLVQDYLFHAVALEAGKLGLAVQIHTGAGCGEFFDDPGSDPMMLIGAFNDASLRGTKFVMLHGGSPFNRNVVTLLVKPNVYVDTSVLELMFSPRELANIMRPWLETMPEHVLFGTDAGPWGPGVGWEESELMGTRRFRQALGLVLTEMMKDGTIEPARAQEVAQQVLRGNAMALYGIK